MSAATDPNVIQPGYPKFRYVESGKPGLAVSQVGVEPSGPGYVDQVADLVRLAAEERGLGFTAAGPCDWLIRFDVADPEPLSAEASAAWKEAASVADGYALRSHLPDGGPAITTIHAPTARAAAKGVFGAMSMYAALSGSAARRFVGGLVVDYPSVADRGVVEGAYRFPYTCDERVKTIRLMGHLRESVYLYGPKYDPYHRDRWADPYPKGPKEGKLRDGIEKAAREARKRHIRFVWAVHPGVLFDYRPGGPHVRKLRKKIDSVRSMGVEHFGLFLDDTLLDVGLLASKQAGLANLVRQHVGSRIYFVGPAYHNAALGALLYVRTLAKHLNDQVDLLWTGPSVYSRRMTARDFRDVNEALGGRRVCLWDNWPTPLEYLTWRPRPVRRGDPCLCGALSGFLSNPTMNEFALREIADFWRMLGPLADFRWNAPAYDATASYRQWKGILASLAEQRAPDV